MITDEDWGITPYDMAEYVRSTKELLDEVGEPTEPPSFDNYADRCLDAGRRAVVACHDHSDDEVQDLVQAFARLDTWLTIGGREPTDWEALNHAQVTMRQVAKALDHERSGEAGWCGLQDVCFALGVDYGSVVS